MGEPFHYSVNHIFTVENLRFFVHEQNDLPRKEGRSVRLFYLDYWYISLR